MAEVIKNFDCGAWLLSRHKRRWPAIILAASRTLKVNGRMVFLINSMQTIKGIRGLGVPRGTKWAKMF